MGGDRLKQASAESEFPIDIVIPWVDGGDPVWLESRAQYRPDQEGSSSTNRFRDWGLLRYWFRGIEAYAPWVRTIHFVTNGQHPSWLDLDHPKLHFVRHEDYIPRKYLPLFNSSAIEVFFNRIEGLSEHFIEFNDDTYLTAPATPSTFFVDGLPCDAALMGTVNSNDLDAEFPHIALNDTSIINKYFSKKDVLRKQRAKFLSPKYGKDLLRNLGLWQTSQFSCFQHQHLPASHVKSIWDEVWSLEGEALEKVGTYRFRSKDDLTQWVFLEWQICKGAFVPRSTSWGRFVSIGEPIDYDDLLSSGKVQAICLNDDDPNLDFESCRAEIHEAFERALPNPSTFELN